ncbi:sugar ABC transporter substrate-binding protein [Cohnella cholangitidis]|uniref:Sugar ABC transporter substrate-binding protein n=1 Tax=Cohnella cholangitidis TaxID=2598458 RepID=A0A7G5BVY7_9BACL|nr:substrate-binding domain-containing protein [Cohnella cholangitidis]QMV41121.1 sugar ABC transporter substrate-binding protein [Cohnella cholangitidis]
MRKTVILVLGFVCAILFYFTFVSAYKVFRSEWQLPRTSAYKQAEYRIVLITQELETPFWVKVGGAATEEALKHGASIEVWGSYGKNQEDFLKKIEIAIASKVDGIIVQGLDTDEFKNLTRVKAAFYGIPIITVANDVPMIESLRRTYVGSDHFLAGQMIARQLLSDMGTEGNVILMGDSRREYYQQQRINGIHEVLERYPNVRTEYAETPDSREQVSAATKDLMNRIPDVNAFIAVNANIAGAMIQEIGRRSQVEPYDIYSFDDSPDALSLLMQGKLDGMIEQSPETMGRISVNLMIKWLSGDTVPLDTVGYLTDIRMLKAAEAQ